VAVYAGLAQRRAIRSGRISAPDGGSCFMVKIDPLLLAAIFPLILIDLAMVIYSIYDLYKPERRVRGDNKLVWLLVILLVSTLGWVAYLIAGREQE
jgi:phospholipase D-like protein